MIVITILLFIVAMSLPSFQNSISTVSFSIRISTLSFIYAGALAFNALYIQEIGSGIGIYSGLFQVTYFSQYIDIFILLVGSACIVGVCIPPVTLTSTDAAQEKLINTEIKSPLAEHPFTGAQKKHLLPARHQYALIVLFSTLGSLMLVSSSDLISMYLSIELQSFGVYILATLYRDSALATSAGLKYFLLGGLSSCLILLGAGLIYSNTGLTNFESIYSLLGVCSSSSWLQLASTNYQLPISLIYTQGLLIGFTLIFVGFLFKIAAAPLHNWAPDVYDDSPTVVTLWLTIMPKIAILIFLLEVTSGLLQFGEVSSFTDAVSVFHESIKLGNSNTISTGNLGTESNFMTQGLQILLLLSSLLSLLIGTIVGLSQTKIKRLLAYSTISHIGFMLLALSCSNTEQSIESFIFYIIQYTITNLNVFIILIAFAYTMIAQSRHSQPMQNEIVWNLRQEVIQQPKESAVSALGSYRQDSNINESELVLQHDSKLQPELAAATRLNPKLALLSSVVPQHSDIKFITELRGQFYSNPLLSISFAICLFSMAGIPPLIGFFSKQMVLYTAIQNGYYFMAIIAIIVSVISASYYLKIIKTLFTEEQQQAGSKLQPESSPVALLDSKVSQRYPAKVENYEELGTCSNSHSFLISTLTLTIFLYILNPSILLNSTQLLSLTLFSSF